jgi:aspartyl-tRNA(Asn)/glutamyl-tRNA(Gln) amidotransferase subunit C
VQRLAELSQIEVTPQEAEEWGPKIAEIVDWFGQLQSVDTDSVEPALRAAIKNESNMLRPDTVQEFEQRGSLMKEMPEMEGPYVKVPKVF